MFEIVQYKTKPAGIHANITVKSNGIHFIIRWVWATGSSFLASDFGVDALCIYCCNHIVAPISIGRIK